MKNVKTLIFIKKNSNSAVHFNLFMFADEKVNLTACEQRNE